MRIWKSSILLIVVLMLVLTSISVNAVSDAPNDVWHQTWSVTGWSWEAFTGTKNNIDITDISFSIDGSTATTTMTTVESISDSENIVYTVHFRSSDETNFYMIIYVNGVGSVLGMGDFAGYMEILDNPVSGNTFTASFEVSDPELDYDVFALNTEYNDISDTEGESWWDYAPDTDAPWYGLGDDTGGDDMGGDDTGGDDMGGDDTGGDDTPTGTPGFETLAVIAALGVAFIILRRKK